MSHAYMGQILKINLTNGDVKSEPTRMDWAQQFLGAAGLATRYLMKLAPRGVDPLSPENPLIFMSGPLTGTPSASASRYSVVAMSPQTGLWGQANSGGTFGPALKWSGYDGIIFEGAAPSPKVLRIIDGQAELCDAEFLWGKDVHQTNDTLIEGNSALSVACIGPAGENLVRFASIMNDKNRAAGRCGLGAVMGAKRLKAIVCGGKAPIQLFDKSRFHQTARLQREYMDESLLKIGFDTFGTNMIADMVNVRGGYPTNNWQKGTFEFIDEVNAQAMTDQILVDGVRCFACPVACGRKTEIRQGKWQGKSGEGPEYENMDTLGAMCGVSDLNAITVANYRCNELGLDAISAGAVIAFSIECAEKGLLGSEWGEEGRLKFGDADQVIDLVEKIAYRKGLGDLLAEGTKRMAERIGGGSAHFAMNVKGLELPAYDPRAAKITGLGYVTANRGGDHMTGYIQGPTFIDIPFLIVDESSIRDPFVPDPKETQVLIDMENALSTLDASGGCKFMGILLSAQELVDLINSATGWNIDVNEFRRIGERIFNLERVINVRAGLRRADDLLPARLMEDPLPDGPAQGMLIERQTMEMLKDAYYDRRGWDEKSGIPTPEKLRQLELEWLIEECWG